MQWLHVLYVQPNKGHVLRVLLTITKMGDYVSQKLLPSHFICNTLFGLCDMVLTFKTYWTTFNIIFWYFYYKIVRLSTLLKITLIKIIFKLNFQWELRRWPIRYLYLKGWRQRWVSLILSAGRSIQVGVSRSYPNSEYCMKEVVPWRSIWRVGVPQRVAFSSWVTDLGAILMQYNLQKRAANRLHDVPC